MQTATLVNFKQKFNTPPPVWFKEIKEEAYRKITEAPFTEVCKRADIEGMKILNQNLWPFIELFPRLVQRGYLKLLKPRLFFRHGFFNMTSLVYQSIVFLFSIKRDEKIHSRLWVDAGIALGLQYPDDFKEAPTPETLDWIKEVSNKSDPTEMFFAFASIEVIAESASHYLLGFQKFKEILGEKGIGWFTVHTIDHRHISHQNLELRLAFAFDDSSDENTQIKARRIILGIVDKFVTAANAGL